MINIPIDIWCNEILLFFNITERLNFIDKVDEEFSNDIKNYFQLFKQNGYHAYASIPDIKYLYPLANEFENSNFLHDYY